ncbi:DUF6924 domain-containing protein [Saccharopolyspora elongata]|uniref:Uncharacterized protein n=1 Tax=Saccharopolyspora elongata TaxID=2530387 RepID=A0A4R4YZL8_9PSEU|nr:hypothetical protein [Saccharopolyspora elongata]TDD50114.1 hypothetical protein E1288_18050 [Saccharopolyspora elongata]
MQSASGDASVFVFRMWRRDLAAVEWEPGPRLLVHLAEDGSAVPEQLSWVTRDGAESALAFAPDMSSCFGHRRAASAHLVQVRGELEGHEVFEDADGVHGFEFTTETLGKGWHPAGRLRFLIDDGEESPLQWAAWRDRSGNAYSVGLWKPGWSGESEEFVVSGLTLKRSSANFIGYRQPAGQAPVAYRGTLVEPPEAPLFEEAREPVAPAEVPAGTPQLPLIGSVPLVRTDFSDDEAWAAASSQVTAPRQVFDDDVFTADVEPVDDIRFEGLTAAQLVQLVPPDADWALLVVADKATMESPERHVLVVDLDEENLGQTFRATPPAIQEIENNLSIANMDWEEFAGNVDENGIVQPML